MLISIIWLSFCCASIFAFGHQFQSLTTIGLASQMFFDAMLTMDTSQFYQQMAHAAYSPWVLQLFFWSWFIIVAVLLINIFLCIFVEAYCIIIADSRTATPMWTELYHVLQHDMRAIFLSKSKFMSDQRLLDILQEDPHQKANLPGQKELRALVIAQLDHHRERKGLRKPQQRGPGAPGARPVVQRRRATPSLRRELHAQPSTFQRRARLNPSAAALESAEEERRRRRRRRRRGRRRRRCEDTTEGQ